MDANQLTYCTTTRDEGKSVLSMLQERLRLSNRLICKLKRSGGILLDGVPVHTNRIVSEQQTIRVCLPNEAQTTSIVPEAMNLDILYEDDWLLAINKPSGMVTHPSSGHRSGTVANGILFHYQTNGESGGIHLISRLDRDTTGVVLAAKNSYIQEALKQQADKKEVEKIYVGLVCPSPSQSSGWIRHPISRLPGSIIRRQADAEGAPAATYYCVRLRGLLPNGQEAAWVEFRLETGRTHQIRVHCQAEGFPLLGDSLYAQASPYLPRQALHAFRIGFRHPVTGQRVQIQAPLPQDLSGLLCRLQKKDAAENVP